MPGIVQCSSFGQFGNALFQYCFARAYAERLGATLETSYWVGQRLFKGVNEPPLSCKLPKTMMDQLPSSITAEIDLHGYFQNKECLELYSVRKAKEWLQFKPEWAEQFPKKFAKYIAIHMRHGDYVTRYAHQFCLISAECQYQFAHHLNSRLDDLPIVVVSEENAEDYDDPEISFLPDFFTLMQADYLIRANSTFSWWAGTLGNGRVYSPVVGDLVGWNNVPYVEGNSEPLLNYQNHGRLHLRDE